MLKLVRHSISAISNNNRLGMAFVWQKELNLSSVARSSGTCPFKEFFIYGLLTMPEAEANPEYGSSLKQDLTYFLIFVIAAMPPNTGFPWY